MVDIILQDWINPWFVLVVLLYFTWSCLDYWMTPKNLPPGPWRLPIVGSFTFCCRKPHFNVTKLKKKYGDICLIHVLSSRIVILNSFDAIKDAFLKQANIFSARPLKYFPRDMRRGIMLNHGELWADYRRFSIATIKTFGIGITTLEPKIKDEISYVLKEMRASEGKPIDISNLLRMSATNIICLIITGKRNDYNDPEFVKLLKYLRLLVDGIGFGTVEQLLPDVFRNITLMNFLGIRNISGANKEINALLARMIEQSDLINGNDFINAWKEEAERQPKKPHFNDEELIPVLRDLFVAGSDTTGNSVLWGILYLMKHPEVQEKMQQEIDEVIGRERTPSLSDQKNLPYIEATIMEMTRITSLLPFLTHSAHEDTTLNGYFIPKGTSVFANVWAVHHDPEIFPDPYEFKPERFLTDDGQVKKTDKIISFSMGKRQCIGETMARSELFLYFTTIFQNFTLKKVDGTELDFDHHYSIVISPKPYELHAFAR